jgi:hypothetical protein
MVLNFSTSKKSALLKWSSLFVIPVSIEAASIFAASLLKTFFSAS